MLMVECVGFNFMYSHVWSLLGETKRLWFRMKMGVKTCRAAKHNFNHNRPLLCTISATVHIVFGMFVTCQKFSYISQHVKYIIRIAAAFKHNQKIQAKIKQYGTNKFQIFHSHHITLQTMTI